MPTWWGKSSSKEDKRKASKESFINAISRKLKITSDEKSTSISGGSRRRQCDTVSERGSLSRVPSRSLSPSKQVSHCQSFAERPHAQPLPLPLPGVYHAGVALTNSRINASTRPGFDRGSRPSLFLPLPKPGQVSNKLDPIDAEGDVATASISSDDPSDSRLLSPLTSDCENGQRTAANCPSGIKHMDQLHVVNQKYSEEILKPANISFNNQYLSTSPKQGPSSNHVQNLQIPQRGAFSSASDSSMSSPSRSPMRAFCLERVWNSGPCTGKPFSDIVFLGSGYCSSPGSGHNSVGGDMSGQLFWPQSRCSPECSPIPSPRKTSPGLSSRILSGAVPLHPRAAGAATESPKRGPSSNHVQNLQIPQCGAFSSASYSSMSSPSRSPMRAFCLEQVWNSGPCTGKPFSDIAFLGSGHCSSPGSGHNSVGGDMSGQLFWPQSRCSPECSPIPSPRMTSPGPSSRIHSGAVTPLHPRAAGAATESPTSRPDDGKQQSHSLPLPSITITNTCPFSPAYSAATSPSLPRSLGRAENPTSPGSCWKKGRLLGRGTFGYVYRGFNSESGEMCAMKEVTLFSDDAKSKESAQQLGQEIMQLNRLQHQNIVQYYGYETVDDKLFIYLEYVSGGSIYKLLQEYGQFGESAIRNYTQQILSGLAYLHAKNTVHRDIKGSNILVDPNGRVKLADFGIAKHITGSSCPFSLKGSPYWMAPEVISNSFGCNLAVDIWSLGCTVLEMATTKPPWSQYEGAAAMFKIGYSKELPEIPDSLSDEGKDFVRQCLQRNPLHRPTAAWLLEHPFVKNAAPLERPIFSADASDPSPAITNAMRTL
ncbi:hypothetical protein CRYUN_Cryun19dG0123400 [Craigia yunnanensis]